MLRVKLALSAVVIVLAVFAAYTPAFRNGFVWDDTALILRDPLIRSWRLIPEGFAHFLFLDATPSDFYRPLQRLVYTLDYWAFAMRPAAYHVTSVLCHAAAAIALWAFARELLRRSGAGNALTERVSFGAALLWAVHPVHTAAVSYAAGLADPLAAAFGFAGLSSALRSEDADKRQRWSYSLAAALLFLASALSKESGLLFPILWLVLLAARKRWGNMVSWMATVVPVLILYLSLRLSAEHLPAPHLHPPLPPLVRPIVACRAVAEYASILVIPRTLHVERDLETHPRGANEESFNAAAERELETLWGIVLLAAFAFWAVRVRHDRATFICLLLAVVCYLPISGIFALNANMAEHWIYVPSAFLFIAAGLTLAHALSARRWLRRVACAAVTALAVAFAARTFVRNFDWRDQRTFFERTITSGGDSARILVNLANVEMNESRLAAAHEHLRHALEKEPDLPFALLASASLAIREKDFKTAHQMLDRAAAMPVVAAQAQELRVILENHESGETDLIRMRLAARTGPPNWPIEKRYIRLLAETGLVAAAITELRSVLARESYRAESWQLLAELLQRAGDKAQASDAMGRARELDVHLALRPRAL